MRRDLVLKRSQVPTLVDVAREAGVSLKTASRVLNRSKNVSQEKAQKIRDVMERLGYRPLDDSESYAATVLAAETGQAADPIAERYQGGTFCAAEYSAQTPRP